MKPGLAPGFSLGDNVANIKHLEDLPREQILHFAHHLHKMDVTEKIDGSNLVFGFDEDGKFYTTRKAKGQPERFYCVDDYPKTSVNNIFKAAHSALSAAVSKWPHRGMEYEVEVLYGRQPNAIVYGSNRIVFITPYPDDIDKRILVNTDMILSDDGLTLYTKRVSSSWTFSTVPSVETMGVLVPSDLPTVDIKAALIDRVLRQITPAFRDVEDVEEYENFGVEGVVIKDRSKGIVTKLVDKHTFTLINQFNFAIRNELKSTGPRFNPANNRDLYQLFSATVGYQETSIYDTMLSEIADLIGIRGLGKYMTITRTLKKYPDMDHFIADWKLLDFESAVAAFDHTIGTTIDRLSNARETFNDQWQTYKLVLTSGQTIYYTDEIYRRTLLVFAENFKEMAELREKIANSTTWEELAEALYAKQLRLAFPNQ